MVLLPKALTSDLVLLFRGDCLLNFRECCKAHQDVEQKCKTSQSEVHVLHSVQTILVGSVEEGMGGNNGTDYSGDTIESLSKGQPHGRLSRRAEDGNVRVGGRFERCKAASSNKSKGNEHAVLFILCRGPKEDRSNGKEAETNVDTLVTCEWKLKKRWVTQTFL